MTEREEEAWERLDIILSFDRSVRTSLGGTMK